MMLNKIAVAIFLALTLLLTACVSSGTSSYGNAVTVSYADRDKASARVKKLKLEIKKSKKALSKHNRSLKKATRRLKRLGKRKAVKSRRKLAKIIAKDRKQIAGNRKKLKNTERQFKKAERNLNRANRRAKSAEKRRNEYERRQASLARAKKAKAERKAASGSSSSLFGLARSENIKYSDYKARTDGGFKLPAVPVKKMNKKFLRQEVAYRTGERPGTLIVDTKRRFLYLIQSGGKAMRYGIGVGKAGFEWSGKANVAWKQEWPKWTPPDEMIDRRPDLAKYGGENGMSGGPKNPLGARALYIHQNGKDTLYRLHGSPVWASIGTAASSGCIRLINQDVIDLYSRVRNGAKIIVKQG